MQAAAPVFLLCCPSTVGLAHKVICLSYRRRSVRRGPSGLLTNGVTRAWSGEVAKLYVVSLHPEGVTRAWSGEVPKLYVLLGPEALAHKVICWSCRQWSVRLSLPSNGVTRARSGEVPELYVVAPEGLAHKAICRSYRRGSVRLRRADIPSEGVTRAWSGAISKLYVLAFWVPLLLDITVVNIIIILIGAAALACFPESVARAWSGEVVYENKFRARFSWLNSRCWLPFDVLWRAVAEGDTVWTCARIRSAERHCLHDGTFEIREHCIPMTAHPVATRSPKHSPQLATVPFDRKSLHN